MLNKRLAAFDRYLRNLTFEAIVLVTKGGRMQRSLAQSKRQTRAANRGGQSPRSSTTTLRRAVQPLFSWSISTAVHLGMLLVLALWVMPNLHLGNLIIEVDTQVGEAELEELSVSLGDELNLRVEAPAFVSASVITELSLDPLVVEPPTFARGFESGDLRAPSVGSSGTLDNVFTVDEAVDRVTDGIKGRLQTGDLLVVWLLDASNSLVDDRQRVAQRLESFFNEIKSGGAELEDREFLNAVVSFGARLNERVAPTESIDRVVRSVKKIPIDSSGKENIFTAIKQSVVSYRQTWKSQLLIVVWTDESGDDTDKLEETIAFCNANQVSVFVVGPSAVLGADTGLHAFTEPKSGLVYQLPVTRGPDTALPERLRLGYWYWPRPPSGEPRDGQRQQVARGRRERGSRLPPWYGGRDLKGLTSGFSPFALTRLTLQTGGTYTIFDRETDRGPFQLQRMREYLPDYGPAEHYHAEIQAYPLRKAVYEAVKLTQRGRELGPPDTRFFGSRLPVPPHRFESLYFTPAQFQRKLFSARRQLMRDAKHTANVVEEALALLNVEGESERGLEHEYSNEDSRRWRAWYDLTCGRLLATSVRLEEYRLVCKRFREPGFLQDTTNHLAMFPSRELRCDAVFARRAEEAQRLLQRCVDDNRDTPWEYLAQRELDHALGINVRQMALSPVPLASEEAPILPRF